MPSRTDRDSGRVVSTILGGLAGVAIFGAVALAALVGYYIFALQAPSGVDPAMAGLAVGRPAPPIAAEGWLNGEPSDLAGKVVVVHGWFYDCPYCWQEAPRVAALHEKYGDRVAFVALTTDEAADLPKVEEFVAKGGMKYPVGYGFDAAMTLVRGFEAQAFPAVWVVGPDGTVLWNRSLEGEQSLEEAIRAALAGGKA
ncbi:MAG TPA: TlpA disulfide reductase family protein [Planctomycetaceae bacterium]